MGIKLRWLRSPALHFVLIGGLLFALSRGLHPLFGETQEEVKRDPVLISAQRIRWLEADFVRQWGRKPSGGQLQALIEQAIDQELLYREARVLALDFEDGSVRRRLVQKMRAVSDGTARSEEALYRQALALGLDDDLVIRRLLIEKMRLVLQRDPNAAPLQDEELLDYLERHRERFVQPATVTFAHVFLSEAARGGHLEEEAQAVLAQLRSHPPSAAAAVELSDPFPLGRAFRSYSQVRIAARFGERFAERVFDLKPGQWSGPIASPYGLHLVWVYEKVPERMPALAAVREQVVYGVLRERAAKRLQQGLLRLRGLYEVRVERTDAMATPDASLARGR